MFFKKIKYFETLQTLPKYNWDKYMETQNKNWFVVGYDQAKKEISNKKLDELAEHLQEEYFKIAGGEHFVEKLQKHSKRDFLVFKYNTIIAIINLLIVAVRGEDMKLRFSLIKKLEKFNLGIPIINTTDGDIQEIERIQNLSSGFITQIQMIDDELKENISNDKMSTNKELILVGTGLELGYQLDPKQISIAYWVELVNILKEKTENLKRIK
jgi:hypothetical protein